MPIRAARRAIRSLSSAFGPINRVESGGTASYNGLIVSLQRRPIKGVFISGNYTFSHCITDLYQDVANPQNADEGWNDWTNRRYDRGNCAAGAAGGGAEDRRHIFNLSGTAASPQFANSRLRVLASGWQLAPILRILSGGAVNVENITDPALIYMLHQRPDLVLASPYGDKSIHNYLNPKAFAAPLPGTFGNLGRAAIQGPGTWQFDVALSRNFRFKEAQRVEVRAEAFNLTNSFRMDNLDSNSTSGTFGQVTSARDPRIMQFALKYFF